MGGPDNFLNSCEILSCNPYISFMEIDRNCKLVSQDNLPALGIDFGGVIIPKRGKSGEDTGFDDNFVLTEPNQNAIEIISLLVKLFRGRVWIVSKAGPYIEELTRKWLSHNEFYAKTGMREENIHFCRERTEKKDICEKFGITFFIDDKLHVMQILKDTVPNLYLFGDKTLNRGARNWTTLVENWDEVYMKILNIYSPETNELH